MRRQVSPYPWCAIADMRQKVSLDHIKMWYAQPQPSYLSDTYFDDSEYDGGDEDSEDDGSDGENY